jgi:hypothetical protein
MPVPNPPAGTSVLVVRLGMTLTGQELQNVLHYACSTTTSVNPDNSHAAAYLKVSLDLYPAMQAAQVLNLTHRYVETQLFQPGTNYAPIRTYQDYSGTFGDVEALPSSVALCIKKMSDLAGAKNRGRIFIPGLATSTFDQASGQWMPATMILGGAIGNTLLGSFTATGAATPFRPVVMPADLSRFAIITNTVVNPVPRNQRRRQVGRGI